MNEGRVGLVASCAMATLVLLAGAVIVSACAPGEEPTTRSDCLVDIGMSPQGVLTTTGCGGCDTRCWLSTDDPDDVAELEYDPADPDFNADMVGYEPAPDDGIVLDGAIAGPDDDGDGLGNSVDPSPNDANGDQDHDGYPDSWEIYQGTDPNDAGDPGSVPAGELYVVLPDGGAPFSKVIPPTMPLTVRSADIYFLIDTTYSMADEITNLRNSLSTYVIPQVQARIPDVQFGVGEYRDYVDDSGAGNLPYGHRRSITSDTVSVQNSLNSLVARSTLADLAESGAAALWAVATGNGLGCNVPAGPACAGGRWGYPCFRPDAQPVIVLVTDHEVHNGVWDDLGLAAAVPGSCYVYASGGCNGDSVCLPIPGTDPDPTLQDAVAELVARDIKVVGIWSGTPNGGGRFDEGTWGITYPDYNDAIDIWYTVTQTGSTDAGGVPFLFGIASNGTGIGAEVVNGIDALVSEIRLDATATWLDADPAPPDTSVLVSDVDPTWCEDCDSLNVTTNTAMGVWPGTGVEFTVDLDNSSGQIPRDVSPREYDVTVEVRSDRGVLLGELTVHVLVPGVSGLITAPTVGHYSHVFNESDTCLSHETVHWERLIVDMDTPAGTDITFTARTENDVDDFDTAVVVPLPLDANVEGDIQTELGLAGLPVTRAHLMIEATLTASTPGDTPILHSMIVEHYCF